MMFLAGFGGFVALLILAGFFFDVFLPGVASGRIKLGDCMRLFNSFQIVGAFVATPFGIAWLQDQEFRGSTPAFYASCGLYVLAFGCMVASVYSSLGKFKD